MQNRESKVINYYAEIARRIDFEKLARRIEALSDLYDNYHIKLFKKNRTNIETLKTAIRSNSKQLGDGTRVGRDGAESSQALLSAIFTQVKLKMKDEETLTKFIVRLNEESASKDVFARGCGLILKDLGDPRFEGLDDKEYSEITKKSLLNYSIKK